MGFFVLVFLVSGLFENFYVSSRYSRATSELVAVNRLETAVNDLNESVNLAYLYLSTDGVKAYDRGKGNVLGGITGIEAQLEQRFEREESDACNTVKTYIEKSEGLMESLGEYLNGKKRRGADYTSLEQQYGELQEVYGYVNLRFQNTYTAKLGTLRAIRALGPAAEIHRRVSAGAYDRDGAHLQRLPVQGHPGGVRFHPENDGGRKFHAGEYLLGGADSGGQQ